MVYTERGWSGDLPGIKALVFLSPELEKAVTVKILFLSLPVEGSLAKSLVAPGGGHTTK